ncbi:MAG: hypothetical protein JRN08_03280 [Nitrososphaerota archaeon]|nr:hypothetical protein [Nitrososphaerota archaeon]
MECDVCGREFTTDAALSQHMKDKHGGGAPVGAKHPAPDAPKVVKKQKTLRRRNRHPVALTLVVGVVAAGVVLYFLAAPLFAQPPYPCGSEGTYVHIHPYLQIWIDGKNVTIPADVGILSEGTCTEPIHTHDSSGVLHMELDQSQAGQNWTLGEFFSIWQFSCAQSGAYCPVVNGTSRPVALGPTDILGFTADSTHKVELLVDGTPSAQWGNLNLMTLDYCNATIGSAFPCQTASGNPYWDGGASYPYGTGHKIVIEYTSA